MGMPYSIGDVLAMLSLIMGIMVSGWTLLVIVALFFGRKCTQAQSVIEMTPWKAFGRGILVAATAGFLSTIFIAQPSGVIKLVGIVLFSNLLAAGAIGASGMAKMLGSRIRMMDASRSEFSALARGAGVLVVAGLVPLVGWFAFFPIGFLMALGAGVTAVLTRTHAGSVAADAYGLVR